MLVVDASVVVKVLTQESGSELASDRLGAAPDRTAPDYITIEAASALAKKVRRGVLPLARAAAALNALPLVMPDLAATAPLLPAAMALSATLQHPLYDCLYLALAEQLGCCLLTADKEFLKAATIGGRSGQIELLTN